MTLRAGLIGFGVAGRYFHAPLLRAAGIDVACVVTSRTDAVREFLPEAETATSAAVLIGRADIDLVVIASPNTYHAQQATDALRAGKHVAVDKPLAVSSAQARALSQLAAERGRTLAVFHNRRRDADLLTIGKLIADGRLGEINAYHARWDRYRPAVADRWRERDEAGAGVLFDLGSHLIDQALHLFGAPEWVQADVFTQRSGGIADDGFELLMGKGALRISLGVSSLASEGGWRFRVHGSRGSFLKGGMDPQEAQLRSGMSASSDSFGVEPAEQWGRLVEGASGRSEVVQSERGRWKSYYEDVRGAIEGVGPVPVSADEAVLVLEIIEAALASSREGRRVPLRDS